jgi:hypothetical protein
VASRRAKVPGEAVVTTALLVALGAFAVWWGVAMVREAMR